MGELGHDGPCYGKEAVLLGESSPQSQKDGDMYAHSCLTLCNPTGCNLSGSTVHGIFQASILERVAISFSVGWERGPQSPALQADSLPAEL